MFKVKLVLTAIVMVVIVAAGVWGYFWIKGNTVFQLFQQDNKMEKTATILRSIKNTNRWVFLSVEDEEVVVREHVFGNVVKIYPSYYELGIELADSLNWVEIQETDSVRIANLHLPPIKILNPDAFDDTKVINVYGDASDRQLIEMKNEAMSKLRRRATSGANIWQAERNAEDHFHNLFTTVLKCDSVDIKWQK
jgi:hypothetical protein